MFGDKSTFGLCLNGQNMPKKDQQEFFFYIQQGPITHLLMNKTFHTLQWERNIHF